MARRDDTADHAVLRLARAVAALDKSVRRLRISLAVSALLCGVLLGLVVHALLSHGGVLLWP